MSTNDGGDPVRVSREPADGPFIQRGYIWIGDGVRVTPKKPGVGERCTFTIAQEEWDITYHDAVVTDANSRFFEALVTTNTVATYERRTS